MNKIFRTFLTLGLSFIILSVTFHVDLHDHDDRGGYSICDINCSNEKHHSLSHKCEKCLNNNSNVVVLKYFVLSYNKNSISYYNLNEFFKDNFTHFNIHSRPPPDIF